LEAGVQIDPVHRRLDLNPHDPGFRDDPYPAYGALHAITPEFYWEQYGHWCFAAFAKVNALLRDRRFGRQILHLATREELGWPIPKPELEPFEAVERYSLLELEPPDHTKLRALVNRAFVSRQVIRLAPKIAAIAHRLIDEMESQREADLLTAFATPIPMIVIAELLGVPTQMCPELLQWSTKMVAMYQFGRNEAVEREAVSATTDFVRFLRDYVDEHRKRAADDLISQLIDAESSGSRLTRDELVSTCILLLNAGHAATVHALGNGIKAMLECRVDPNAAMTSTRVTELLVEELLRFDAPLHLFTRYALEDTRIDDIKLVKGDRIGLMLAAANRDPRQYADPDLFDATRSPNPHLSFGAGIHFCVGAPLARLELQVALPILFARLPKLRLAQTPRYRDSYHFHGLQELRVIW
jgi:cytochrome P450